PAARRRPRQEHSTAPGRAPQRCSLVSSDIEHGLDAAVQGAEGWAARPLVIISIIGSREWVRIGRQPAAGVVADPRGRRMTPYRSARTPRPRLGTPEAPRPLLS